MEYKVGDKVRIKHRKYIENLREVTQDMLEHCEMIMTIGDIDRAAASYIFEEDCHKRLWSDEMIEGLSEEIEREHEDKIFSEGYDQGYEDGQHDMNEWILPEGFQFKDENGNVINAQKIVLEKKDNDYPKTYDECCKVLGKYADMTYGYKKYVLHTLQMLLVCRDAYWQIAGQEMGLDDTWEPDYKNPDIDLYVIINIYNQVEKSKYGYGFQHCVLTFPTEEMRDAFFENFKKDIEICKELL